MTEDRGCCSACPVANAETLLVPSIWHSGETRQRFCCPCFHRMYPGEEMISFPAEAVLNRWQAEGFAPSHVMLVRKHNQVMVLVSQLDAHNVGLFREWSPAGSDEDELLRQIARDYRTTKDAVARMPARAWWDQMAIWRFIADTRERKK